MNHQNTVNIIGAGLAGSEAAYHIIRHGIPVNLFEMRPVLQTKAHESSLFAELVCSNSLRGASIQNAVGLLKEELKICDSLIMKAALNSSVPAGGALAVDRLQFSQYIDNFLRNHPLVTVHIIEVTDFPNFSSQNPCIVATGPLTSLKLTEQIEKLTGSQNLAFFDAVSPIVYNESLEHKKMFKQSRYDKGEGQDYWNIPLTKELYYQFVEAVKCAEKYSGNIAVENDNLEKLRPFEGCMPIEDMIERGTDVLRFGPFKPVGLNDPNNPIRPYAVLQLRQDDKAGQTWSMVGMQTRMKRAEQDKIFRMLPGLEKVEFVRFGTVHRNTFIESPKCLNATLEFRDKEGLFFAGQITGVEGYVESTAAGLVAGINAARMVQGKDCIKFPISSAIGALLNYITDVERKNFQPMNISYGIMPSYFANKPAKKTKTSKKDRREATAELALKDLREFLREKIQRP